MATLREFALAHLIDHGLFPNEAALVFAAHEAAPENEPMLHRWRDGVDDYAPALRSVLVLALNYSAVTWIDEHAPRHWARAVFEAA